ncbi:MAG: P-II family nitrogen regulator [Longimonas sp.]
MQMIVAYIRPRMRDAVVNQLRKMKVPGASLSTVEGFGHEAGPEGERTYDEAVTPYIKKLKLEIVCHDDRIDEITAAIADHARTGRRGDGKIFVLPVRQALDIRTPRTGPDVI